MVMKVSEGGRVVIPAEIRRALGLREGDAVVWELRDGEAVLVSRRARLRAAQALIATHCGDAARAGSAVDELIAERRAEAARE
jgi:AbrB family looped-hinge helix DNA binding protein